MGKVLTTLGELPQVVRSTVMRIRTVAKEGALAAPKPGVQARERDFELALARAEVKRLSETVTETAVTAVPVMTFVRAGSPVRLATWL